MFEDKSTQLAIKRAVRLCEKLRTVHEPISELPDLPASSAAKVFRCGNSALENCVTNPEPCDDSQSQSQAMLRRTRQLLTTRVTEDNFEMVTQEFMALWKIPPLHDDEILVSELKKLNKLIKPIELTQVSTATDLGCDRTMEEAQTPSHEEINAEHLIGHEDFDFSDCDLSDGWSSADILLDSDNEESLCSDLNHSLSDVQVNRRQMPVVTKRNALPLREVHSSPTAVSTEEALEHSIDRAAVAFTQRRTTKNTRSSSFKPIRCSTFQNFSAVPWPPSQQRLEGRRLTRSIAKILDKHVKRSVPPYDVDDQSPSVLEPVAVQGMNPDHLVRSLDADLANHDVSMSIKVAEELLRVECQAKARKLSEHQLAGGHLRPVGRLVSLTEVIFSAYAPLCTLVLTFLFVASNPVMLKAINMIQDVQKNHDIGEWWANQERQHLATTLLKNVAAGHGAVMSKAKAFAALTYVSHHQD